MDELEQQERELKTALADAGRVNGPRLTQDYRHLCKRCYDEHSPNIPNFTVAISLKKYII